MKHQKTKKWTGFTLFVLLLLSTVFVLSSCATSAPKEGTALSAEDTASQDGSLQNGAQKDAAVDGNDALAGAAQISVEDAVRIALEDAQFSEEAVTFVKKELDDIHDNDDPAHYDIEFIAGNDKYEYEIDAASGAILDFSKEAVSQQNAASNSSSTATGSDIGLDAAKNAALGHAGLSANDVTFTKAELDRDDGAYEYEIEFISGSTKYEYTVRAKDGAILDFSKEAVSKKSGSTAASAPATNTPATNAPAKDIGLDAAKGIALKNAGLSASDVTFTKAKLDRDDGIYEYEIEFISGSTEYEYTIRAEDGAILEKDVDYD